MTSRGKRFEAEIKDSFMSSGIYAMRIADKLYWSNGTIRSEETPADFIAIAPVDGKAIGLLIECKAVNGKSLPFENVKEHQERESAVFDGWCDDMRGFIAINFYDQHNIRGFNKCFMVPIRTWISYRSESGRKSMPISYCEENPEIIGCDRCKGSMYDMSAFIESLNK